MAEFVGQSLNVIRFQSSLIKDDIVMSWCNSPLPDWLRHKEEIIPVSEQINKIVHCAVVVYQFINLFKHSFKVNDHITDHDFTIH